jgi:hypothetical protein
MKKIITIAVNIVDVTHNGKQVDDHPQHAKVSSQLKLYGCEVSFAFFYLKVNEPNRYLIIYVVKHPKFVVNGQLYIALFKTIHT